jgi:hypothetical protein
METLLILLGDCLLFAILLVLTRKFFGSNERKSVRKHEQKKNICPRCGSELRQNCVDGHIQCDTCKLGY